MNQRMNRSMDYQITPVQTEEQIEQLATIAAEIWNEYFISIITRSQIDYMLARFQSSQAIKEQLTSGYRYFVLSVEGNLIGYTGVRADENKLFLSKLYLRHEQRGKGYAPLLFGHLKQICYEEQLEAIWLTVNRYNQNTIAIYEHWGFKTIRSQVTDIGQGYVMDDYVMELDLRPQ